MRIFFAVTFTSRTMALFCAFSSPGWGSMPIWKLCAPAAPALKTTDFALLDIRLEGDFLCASGCPFSRTIRLTFSPA